MKTGEHVVPEREPVTRGVGVGMYALALASLAGNYVLVNILGLYFPLLLVLVGPLATMGTLTLVHPRFLEVLLNGGLLTKLEKFMKLISVVALLLGGLLGVFLIATYRGEL